MSLLAMPLIVPSDRVKDLALALGFAAPVDADGADTSAFVRALTRIADGNNPAGTD